MGRTRPFSPNTRSRQDNEPPVEAETPPSVGVELLGYGPGGVDLESIDTGLASTPNQAAQRGALLAVVGLVGLAFLALYLLGSSSAPSEQSVDPPGRIDRPTPTVTTSSAAPSNDELAELDAEAVRRANVEFLEELKPVDATLLEGLVIAWIGDDDRLALRELDTGAALPVSTLAEHDLPPLPKHIQLIGARNATWLIDLAEPEYSGKLSNTVRMVRLGAEIDSYGFISEGEDGGPTDFFVGSLWGPSMNGTAQTPNSWTILPVPGSGIVVSSPTAESASIRGSGLEPLPRHVGRVVAATADHLAGISCDNRLQCVGVVSHWDGTEQQVFDATALSNSATVRISPDGGHVVSVIGTTWTIVDLEADESQKFEFPIPADSSVTWTPDSSAIVWVVEGTVVAIDLDRGIADGFEPALVSPVGILGERLPDSDVGVYSLEAVVTPAVVNG